LNIARSLQEAASNAVEWNINKIKFNGGTLNSSNVPSAIDLKFNNNGTKVYYLTFNNIYEYDLSVAYDLSTKTNLVLHDLNNPNNNYSFYFKPDGTKMYVGLSNTDVYEYSLSVPWDLTTLSYVQTFYSGYGVYISLKPDGTKLFIVLASQIREYALSTAWDISTATVTTTKYLTNTNTNFSFKPDGTKLFLAGAESVDTFTLSTAWDVSTASYDSTYLAPGEVGRTSSTVVFNNTGTVAFINNYFSGGLQLAFNLSTAWDFSTASPSYPSSDFLSLDDGSGIYSLGLSPGINTGNCFFSTDGTKLYFPVYFENKIFYYSLGTAWDITSASYVGVLTIGSSVDIRSIFISPDGLYLFIAAFSGQVLTYTLGTLWNILTASYTDTKVFNGFPKGIFFSPDGTKFYYTAGSSSLYQYTLSTPWNLATATLDHIQNISNVSFGLYFRPDGGTFYIADISLTNSTETLREFEMSTPWDVSTASQETGVVLNTFIGSGDVKGIYFRDNGKKVYVAYQDFNRLLSYDL